MQDVFVKGRRKSPQADVGAGVPPVRSHETGARGLVNGRLARLSRFGWGWPTTPKL